jgi:hypothetical protein
MPKRSHLRSRAKPRVWTCLATSLVLASLGACAEPRFGDRSVDASNCVEPSCEGGSVAVPVSKFADAALRDGAAGASGPADPALARPAQELDGGQRGGGPGPSVKPDPGAAVDPGMLPPAHDGGGVSPPSANEWPMVMKGRYAIRARFFSYTNLLLANAAMEHEIIYLASVDVDPAGRVWMETKRCYDFGRASAGPAGAHTFRWRHPENLPPEKFELVWRDGAFQTVPLPRAIGYVAESPAACKTETRAPAPDSKWLRGTCECRTEPLPIVTSDCRVTDADGDGEAGFTVDHEGLGGNGVNHVRTQDNCQIVNGKIVPGSKQHTANYIESYKYFVMTCNGATNCDNSPVEGCPIAVNPVLFAPLADTAPSGAAWDCAAVMDQANQGMIFNSEMLNYPAQGC